MISSRLTLSEVQLERFWWIFSYFSLATVCLAAVKNESTKNKRRSYNLLREFLRNNYRSQDVTVIDVYSEPTETLWQHPAYISYADCTCDLQESYCDRDCCCDKDCSSEAKNSFNCSNEANKRLMSNRDEWIFSKYNCSDKRSYQPSELYFLLCLARVNTPYLGHFYDRKSTIRSVAEFGDILGRKANSNRPRYVGSDSQQPKQLSGFITSPLSYGSLIKTADFQGRDGGYLSLPGAIISGNCVPSVPIRYLVESDAVCNVAINAQTCANDATLQPSFYLSTMDVGIFNDLKNMTDDNETIIETPIPTQMSPKISVKYWCYQASNILAECTSPVGDPVFNESSKTCDKAVKAVKYEIFWNGSRITHISVDITIGQLSQVANDNLLSYSVRFSHHLKSSMVNTSLPERSGNPGYDAKRLLIGVKSGSDGKMITAEDTQLYSWRSDISGLCEAARFNRLAFLEEVDSSCYQTVLQTDFKNCITLWGAMKAQLDILVNATHISRYGTVQSLSGESFVRITQENLVAPSINKTKSNLPYYCPAIVYHLDIDIVYENPYELNMDVHEVVGIYVHYRNKSLMYESTQTSAKFPLSSSVRFIRVPTRFDAKTKSFYLRERRDKCPSDVTCWNELFYPFVNLHPAYDFKYSLSFGLAFMMFISAALYIHRWS